MPKVLIREYDNSTTGLTASNNFAVVVPGYFADLEKVKTYTENGVKKYAADRDLWNSSGVYELKSQSEFVEYIGRHTGVDGGAAGPILNVTIYDAWDKNEYSTYINSISVTRFEEALKSGGAEKVYKVVRINSVDDPVNGALYGTDNYLVRTIEYHEVTREQDTNADGSLKVDAEGEPIYVYTKAENATKVTVKLTEVTSSAGLHWNAVGGIPTTSQEEVCILKAGCEGSAAVAEKHIGNQIAYELLGLGYTVLYKRLDATQSATDQLSNPEFWTPLKDKAVFNFRYITTGGCYEVGAMNQICQVATFVNNIKLEDAETYGKLSGRGDCIALCDINENLTDHIVSGNNTLQTNIRNIGYAAKAINYADQYSAIFGPKVTYVMDDHYVKEFGDNKTFPASFHYLACAARAFERYNEWYAVAGYNRGISNYAIANTSVKLGEIAINTLAPRKINDYTTKSVNLILHERGNYYLWGNRTGYALADGLVFHHFLNIRQLCCSIKKQLYTACRQFTFDPNSDLLWINFVNAIKPTLEAMKADQGIKGYTISRVADTRKALLTARIRIVPIEAVEDFEISIYLEDSLTGIVVNASEAQA